MRTSVVQQAEEKIREYIIGDAVSVGDKLPTEKQLCEQLNVGRGTVREAVRTLQAQGYVELRPGRGAFVLRKEQMQKEDIVNWFSANECDVRELIDIRTALEPLAVRLAIQKCTDEEVNKLKGVHERTIYAAKTGNAPVLGQCDEQFHDLIFQFSRNKPLLGICRKLSNDLIAFRSKTFFIPQNIQNLITAHGAVLEAFIKRDTDLGVSSMQMHIALVASDLEKSKEI